MSGRFLGETLSGGLKILQRIVSGEDFSESLQVEFLGDGFMRRFKGEDSGRGFRGRFQGEVSGEVSGGSFRRRSKKEA